MTIRITANARSKQVLDLVFASHKRADILAEGCPREAQAVGDLAMAFCVAGALSGFRDQNDLEQMIALVTGFFPTAVEFVDDQLGAPDEAEGDE